MGRTRIKHLRTQHQNNLISRHKTSGNSKLAKKLRGMQQAEQVKQVFQRCRTAQNTDQEGGLTHVLVPEHPHDDLKTCETWKRIIPAPRPYPNSPGTLHNHAWPTGNQILWHHPWMELQWRPCHAIHGAVHSESPIMLHAPNPDQSPTCPTPMRIKVARNPKIWGFQEKTKF